MNKEVLLYAFRLAYLGGLSSILLMIFMFVNQTFSPYILKKLCNTIGCAFLLLILECVDFYFEEVQGSVVVRQVIGSINYFLRICCVGLFAILAQRNNKRHAVVVNISILILVIICIVNIWYPILFKINADQTWKTGPLFFWPYLIVVFYIYFFLEASFKQFYTNRGESLIVLAIITMCLLANMLELVHNFKTCLPTTFIICIIFYFLSLNIQMYRRDTLTNLLNRRSFYIDLKSWKQKQFFIVSMDLNNLKLINDNEGHSAGDVAICASAKNMQECFKRLGKIYRTGGDEFMAMIRLNDDEEVKKVVEQFQEKMKNTKYTVACGYAQYKPGCNIDSVIEESDTKMYVNKKYLKEIACK